MSSFASAEVTSILGSRRKAFWEDEGYLVFTGFLDDGEAGALTECYERIWAAKPGHIVVDDLVTGRRKPLSAVTMADGRHHFKTNDLYLTEPAIREVALSERLGMILEELLGDEPTICNTLNFDRGSQQPDHLDTLYMTPRTDLGLVATWLCLEDVAADAGPLRYWPGSNHIEPLRFSSGSLHVHDPDMPWWSEQMAGEVERRGLEEQRFLAKRGDLFIWHSLLLHGGSKIANPVSTRESLVTHYWRQSDAEAWQYDIRPATGGWWIKKPPLDIDPDASLSADEAEAIIDFPAFAEATEGDDEADSAGEPELFERMQQLTARD